MIHEDALAERGQNAKLRRLFELVRIFNSGVETDSKRIADALGVSRRTVFRDLRTLREVGYPLDFDEVEHRYRLLGDYQLHKRLDADEIFDAAVGMSLLKSQRSSSPSCEIIRQMVVKQLDPQRINFLNNCLETIQFEIADISLAKATAKEHEWLVLLALSRFDLIKVRLRMKDGKSTAFSPYMLTVGEFGWLAVGRSSLHQHVREIALSEIESIDPSVGEYEVPPRLHTNGFRRVKYDPSSKSGKERRRSQTEATSLNRPRFHL